MFGKILVQEFRNTWRIPFIFSVVAVGLSLLVRWELIYLNDYTRSVPRLIEIAINIFVFMYIIYMIAASAIVVFSMPIRFYRESFGDQGYLYHSLPISKSAFFGAHVLVSSLWVMVYSIVVYCSLTIVFDSWGFFQTTIGIAWDILSRELRTVRSEDAVILIVLAVLFIVYILMSLVETVIMANCAVCLGQNFRRHRTAGAILMYFVLSFLIGLINQATGGSVLLNRMMDASSSLMAVRTIAVVLAISVAAQLAECIVMWIISTRHMTKHLNLE